MIRHFIFCLLSVVLLGCNNTTHNEEIKSIRAGIDTSNISLEIQKDKDSLKLNIDSPGQFISEINCELIALKEDADFYTDGIEPGISIEETKKDISRLIQPNEKVLFFESAILIIDYPLKDYATFKIKGTKNGFSRKELLLEISKIYHQLYTDEENTATVKTLPMRDRNIMNRNKTNGKYGIWGHDLADLILNSIKVFKNSKGQIYLTLDIDS